MVWRTGEEIKCRTGRGPYRLRFAGKYKAEGGRSWDDLGPRGSPDCGGNRQRAAWGKNSRQAVRTVGRTTLHAGSLWAKVEKD